MCSWSNASTLAALFSTFRVVFWKLKGSLRSSIVKMDAILSESFVKFKQQKFQYPRKVPCHQMAWNFVPNGGSLLRVPANQKVFLFIYVGSRETWIFLLHNKKYLQLVFQARGGWKIEEKSPPGHVELGEKTGNKAGSISSATNMFRSLWKKKLSLEAGGNFLLKKLRGRKISENWNLEGRSKTTQPPAGTVDLIGLEVPNLEGFGAHRSGCQMKSVSVGCLKGATFLENFSPPTKNPCSLSGMLKKRFLRGT